MAGFSDSLVFFHASTTGEKRKDHICYEGAPGCLHIEGLVQKQSTKALDLYSAGQVKCISALVWAETLGWHLPPWIWRIWNAHFDITHNIKRDVVPKQCRAREMWSIGYNLWDQKRSWYVNSEKSCLILSSCSCWMMNSSCFRWNVTPCHLLWEGFWASVSKAPLELVCFGEAKFKVLCWNSIYNTSHLCTVIPERTSWSQGSTLLCLCLISHSRNKIRNEANGNPLPHGLSPRSGISGLLDLGTASKVSCLTALMDLFFRSQTPYSFWSAQHHPVKGSKV